MEALFNVHLYHYLFLSITIFSIGALIVMLRKNLIVIFMGIELMLNGVNLSFVSFGHYYQNTEGPIMSFFVMTIAACEAAVGLVLLVHIYKHFKSLEIDKFTSLKG